jgi:hypothetical protein
MQITDGRELIFPSQYSERGYPHDVWSRLRRESPDTSCDPPGYGSFWAITKHADICDISKRPDAFVNRPGHRRARRRADAHARVGPVRARGHEDDHRDGSARAPHFPQGGERLVHAAQPRAPRVGRGREARALWSTRSRPDGEASATS